MCACQAVAANANFTQDAMKEDDPMLGKDMTMQECKDHMAMPKQVGTKEKDAMMKKDTMCADMMKKDGMAKDGMMKQDGAASAPIKK